MASNLSIIALSKLKVDSSVTDTDIRDLHIQSGYSAGICYMPDDYFTSGKCSDKSCLSRFASCIASGHHSVADHAWIEIKLAGVSKALCIWLNSLRFYTTSEKSGRYTVMSADNAVYQQWLDAISERLARTNPELTARQREKIAYENARFMIDVNAPYSTIGYSTSLRQWNLIYLWCKQAREYWVSTWGRADLPDFYDKLATEMESVADQLEELGIRIPELVDVKKCFPNTFLPPVPYGTRLLHNDNDLVSVHDDFVTLHLRGTINMAAQMLRHRRLSVKIDFNPCNYTIIDSIFPEMQDDWVTDMQIALTQGFTPIGIGVPFTVTGSATDIYTMVAERCCGSAQPEIRNAACKIRDEMLNIMAKQPEKFDYDSLAIWGIVADKHKGCRGFTRCCTQTCKSPCRWISDITYNL